MEEDSDFLETIELLKIVGYTVISWSQIERQIDNWVMLVYNRCGGREMREPNPTIPKMFKAKKEFLRKAFGKLDVLAPFQIEANRLLDEAVKLFPTRTMFIHASLENLEAVDGKFSFHWLIHGEQAHTVEDKTFDMKTWGKLEGSIRALRHDSVEFSALLLEIFPVRRK